MPDPLPSEPDPSVLARLRSGDITALSTIFELYGTRVHHLARKMMGNEADAEDVTQEIFVRAFEHADKFQGRSGFYTWLYRLGVRHCLNRIKQLRRSETCTHSAFREFHNAQHGSAPSPVECSSVKERNELVDRLVQSLPGHYRACLVLREVDGLSYAQIAELLEVPVGTVMSRLARARYTLRARLTGSVIGRRTRGNNGDAPIVQIREERSRDDLC